MAVTWRVSHPERLVVVVGKDEVTAADLLNCVDSMQKVGVITYRKVYDMSLVGLSMSIADLQALGKRMASIADGRSFGPVAIVVASNGLERSARHFEEHSGARRPVQIFRDRYEARVWLDEVAPPESFNDPTDSADAAD